MQLTHTCIFSLVLFHFDEAKYFNILYFIVFIMRFVLDQWYGKISLFSKTMEVCPNLVYLLRQIKSKIELLVLLGDIWVSQILGQYPESDFGHKCCDLNCLDNCSLRHWLLLLFLSS